MKIQLKCDRNLIKIICPIKETEGQQLGLNFER